MSSETIKSLYHPIPMIMNTSVDHKKCSGTEAYTYNRRNKRNMRINGAIYRRLMLLFFIFQVIIARDDCLEYELNEDVSFYKTEFQATERCSQSCIGKNTYWGFLQEKANPNLEEQAVPETEPEAAKPPKDDCVCCIDLAPNDDCNIFSKFGPCDKGHTACDEDCQNPRYAFKMDYQFGYCDEPMDCWCCKEVDENNGDCLDLEPALLVLEGVSFYKTQFEVGEKCSDECFYQNLGQLGVLEPKQHSDSIPQQQEAVINPSIQLPKGDCVCCTDETTEGECINFVSYGTCPTTDGHRTCDKSCKAYATYLYGYCDLAMDCLCCTEVNTNYAYTQPHA